MLGCGKVVNNVKSGIRTVTEGASKRAEVAQRAYRIKYPDATPNKSIKVKGWIAGMFKELINGMNGMSESFSVVTGTLTKVKKTVTKTVGKALNENPDASKFKARIEGLKAAMPEIKTGFKEVSGVNDVIAAHKAGGMIKGIHEGVKAGVRVTTSTGLCLAGTVTPVPGGSVAGWLIGEKLTALCLGKPFTKQAKNIGEKLSK